MSLFKLFSHDLRSGILRWRYLLIPLVFILPCFSAFVDIQNAQCVGTWMDYVIGCFKGVLPPDGEFEGFTFPILWLLIIAGTLFINLDYPIGDLTEAGQQVIIRCVNKKLWLVSKCFWCILSSTIYYLLGMLTALVFALATGGSAKLLHTPDVALKAFQIYAPELLTVGETILAAVVLPWLTIVVVNILQMTLSLVMRPLFSFLTCISVMILGVFVNSPFFLGNGAMTSRSGILVEGMQSPLAVVLTCILFLEFCVLLGVLRFKRMDHLRYEG